MAEEKKTRDKREGACKTGPCKMPRRCWEWDTCFLFGFNPCD